VHFIEDCVQESLIALHAVFDEVHAPEAENEVALDHHPQLTKELTVVAQVSGLSFGKPRRPALLLILVADRSGRNRHGIRPPDHLLVDPRDGDLGNRVAPVVHQWTQHLATAASTGAEIVETITHVHKALVPFIGAR